MLGNESSEYYRKREQRQRSLASAAADPAIAAIHLDLAERYSELVGHAEMPTRPKLRLVI